MVLFVLLAPNSRAQNNNNFLNNNRINIEEESLLGQSKLQGDWKISVSAESWEEATDDVKNAAVALRVRPTYRIMDNLKFKSDLQFKSQSGRVQTRFYYNDERLLGLKNATFEYLPLPFLLFEAWDNQSKVFRAR